MRFCQWAVALGGASAISGLILMGLETADILSGYADWATGLVVTPLIAVLIVLVFGAVRFIGMEGKDDPQK